MGRKLTHDDAAVSPVVGVTLVVTVSVLLATTAAAFALGAGGSTDTSPPTAEVTWEYSQVGHGSLEMLFEGTEPLEPGNVRVETSNGNFHPAPGNTSSPTGTAVTGYGLDSRAGGSDWVDGDIARGTAFGIVGGSPGSLETVTVRIVWSDPAGGQSVVLAKWQGPDA